MVMIGHSSCELYRRPCRSRRGVSYWQPLAFLVGFLILIGIVSRYYLIPALSAASDANDAGKKLLAADATLLMTILLVILLSGLVLTFRVGRMFFPRPTSPRTRTKYVDAWAEAGRRMSEGERDSSG